MSDKKKKIAECIGWGATGVGAVILLICGVTTSEINSGLALLDGVVVAVGAVTAFIAGRLKK